jgi:hypothetical protein
VITEKRIQLQALGCNLGISVHFKKACDRGFGGWHSVFPQILRMMAGETRRFGKQARITFCSR